MGKPEGKRMIGRRRRRSKDNIKNIIFNKLNWDIEWTDVYWDMDRLRALMNAVMNLWVS
jgi:hypothetical protein